jgi:F-type H+-transporting ATPase subunit delta
VAGPLDAIAERAEEALGAAGGALPRVAEELPAFARLLRREPRLRLAFTDVAMGPDSKRELLRSVLEGKVDPATLEVLGVLGEHLLSPNELERAADDLAVRGLLAAAEGDPRRGTLEEVEDEVFRFARVIDANPDLRSALTDAALTDDARSRLIDALLADRARAETVELVRFALETRGVRDPGQVLTELADLAATRRGRIVVEARTAIPIDVQRHARLEEALTRAVGRPIALEVVVDPGIGGGVVARVGDELIDGTVRRKLERALEEMTI